MVSLIAFPVLVAVIYAALTAAADDARRPAEPRRPAMPLQLAPTFHPVSRPAPVFVPLPPPAPPPPAPPPVWHAVLSSDASEQALLEALRTAPDDGATRLVYADLLESRGEVARAQFVRGASLRLDEHAVVGEADPTWRAITSCTPIECTRRDCPRTWSALEPSPRDETARHCRACDKTVRHCSDRTAATACTRRGERVVVDPLIRRPEPPELGFDLTSE